MAVISLAQEVDYTSPKKDAVRRTGFAEWVIRASSIEGGLSLPQSVGARSLRRTGTPAFRRLDGVAGADPREGRANKGLSPVVGSRLSSPCVQFHSL